MLGITRRWASISLEGGGGVQFGGQREEIHLVVSCYRNWDNLRPDGPLGSYADFRLNLFAYLICDKGK